VFYQQAHVTKMKKMNFLPVDWMLLFKHSWIWKKTSIAYVRMSRSAIPKVFEHDPNLSLVNTPQTTY